MAETERLISRQFSVRKPDMHEARAIIKSQSRRPGRIIQAEWHGNNGVVLATATIVPYQYMNDPDELRALSSALTNANKLCIQETLPL